LLSDVPGLKDPAAISHIHQQFKVALAHEVGFVRLLLALSLPAY